MKIFSLTGCVILFLVVFGFKNHLEIQSFAGDWKINMQNEGYQSAPKELKIQLTGDSIFIERVTTDDQTFVEKMSFDGKPNTCTTTSGRKKTGTAKWDEEGKSFTENATLGDTGNPAAVAFTVTEHWQLSEDQTQLTIVTMLSNASGGSGERTDVYDRGN